MDRVTSARHFDSKRVRASEREPHLQLDPSIIRRLRKRSAEFAAADHRNSWRYDLEAKQLQFILKPFPAYTDFLGLHSGICFSVPTEQGDLRMRYFAGQNVLDVGAVNAWGFRENNLLLNS
jgi:hypothetical protein